MRYSTKALDLDHRKGLVAVKIKEIKVFFLINLLDLTVVPRSEHVINSQFSIFLREGSHPYDPDIGGKEVRRWCGEENNFEFHDRFWCQ